jgi:hypothetical protein
MINDLLEGGHSLSIHRPFDSISDGNGVHQEEIGLLERGRCVMMQSAGNQRRNSGKT